MGKKEKKHRSKVVKRNQKIALEKNAMKKAIERMFEAQKMMSETENLGVELNGQNIGFEVIEEVKVNEPQVGDQISELEK
jgi:hypothetical protein